MPALLLLDPDAQARSRQPWHQRGSVVRVGTVVGGGCCGVSGRVGDGVHCGRCCVADHLSGRLTGAMTRSPGGAPAAGRRPAGCREPTTADGRRRARPPCVRARPGPRPAPGGCGRRESAASTPARLCQGPSVRVLAKQDRARTRQELERQHQREGGELARVLGLERKHGDAGLRARQRQLHTLRFGTRPAVLSISGAPASGTPGRASGTCRHRAVAPVPRPGPARRTPSGSASCSTPLRRACS